MPIKEEEITEIEVVYPIISIKLQTVAISKGRRINNECEEILNLDLLTPEEAAAAVVKLLSEFESYVSKVVETANSPQGQRELQNILEQNARPAPLPSEDPPSLQQQEADQGSSMAPSGLPVL